MTRRIAITGVDGTGKTTAIGLLQDRFKSKPGLVQAARSPQYHESEECPFPELSLTIENMGIAADKIGDPLLKASCLFLSMSLYGAMELALMEKFSMDFLFLERHPLVDSLAYAQFYTPLLTKPLDEKVLVPVITKEVGAKSLELVLDHWTKIVGREKQSKNSFEKFWNAPLFIGELFKEKSDRLLERLQNLYDVGAPDHLIQLTIAPTALKERLQAKSGSQSQKEFHETEGALIALQAALSRSCEILAAHARGVQIVRVDTTGCTPAEVCDQIQKIERIKLD